MKTRIFAVCVVIFLFFGIANAEINDGLVAYYPFSGNTNDESGNGNNGTVNGATLVPDKFGNANSAYRFNGTNSFIYIGKPVPLSVAARNEITLVAWINPSVYPSSDNLGMIIGSQCDQCGTAGAAIHLDGRYMHGGIPGGIHFQIGLENYGWSTTSSEGTTGVAVPLNQWSHVVATWKSGNTKKVYINGLLVTNWPTVWTGNIKYNSNTEMDIGKQSDLGRYFNGFIDDARVYNRALSASEVQQLYQSQSTPGAPTIGTATAGNAQATVSFTSPASNGGSSITIYTVISNPGGKTTTGSASPITITGLTNGTAYTFTVTATNSAGTSPPSSASNSVTPFTIPDAPIIGTATAGNALATVNFTPPAFNGGSSITGYTVTSNPGGKTATGSTSPITVSGLTNGTAYTFTVTATSAAGTSLPSAASNSVTPIDESPISHTITGNTSIAGVTLSYMDVILANSTSVSYTHLTLPTKRIV